MSIEPTRRIDNERGAVMIAGCAGAERLYRAVRSDPHAPLAVAITGPGGCGKSALLAAVGEAYRAAGVRTVSARTGPVEVTEAGVALLIDDAHELEQADLDRLRSMVDTDGVRLAVAYRPWPRTRGLAELITALRRRRPVVALEHLNRTQIQARARSLLGGPVPVALLDLLADSTRGLPLLIDQSVIALRDSGALESGGALSIPRPVVEQLRHGVDALADGPRELMLAVAVGATLDDDVLGPLLGIDAGTVFELVDQARASGLLLGDGTLLPLARTVILDATPAERVRTVQRSLLDVQLGRGASVLDLARGLARTGVRDSRAAAVLIEAGDRALREDPALAVALYGEAVAVGALPSPLTVRQAEAAALTGDLDGALQLADRAINAPNSPDLTRGVRVAAAVLAHRGLLARSAELYRWLGPARIGSAAPLAALAFLGAGAAGEADAMLATAHADRPPTLLAGAETLMAQGVQESLAGTTASALSTLTRAAALLEPTGRTVLLPDTPAALAALVALHCGELEVASSVLTRAIAHDLGGPPARARHLLLLAWTAMLRGHLDIARDHVNEATSACGVPEPRDELFLRALQVGLAWRAGDLPGLAQAWERAREAIVRHPVDLFALLPLGELLIAAGRLKDSERMVPHLEQARQLLERLGNPVLWGTPLHWAGVHAAIYAEKPADLEPHAAALVKAARTSTYAKILATAGRAWIQVLQREVDVPAVEAAARGLQSVGLAWDGCRLAGQAAVRASDGKSRIALLQCARALQTPSREVPEPSSADSAGSPPERTLSTSLSEREREVAKLVIAGNTYRQIGASLYISAKTVEHHVARIRQRLGAQNRSELFSHLRALLGHDEQAAG